MTKSLDIASIEQARQTIDDLKVVGNGDSFRLLCKASSAAQGWMKSAKALEIPGVGCIVQVTTQQGDHVAEALTFVPGVRIEPDVNGGRKLVDDSEALTFVPGVRIEPDVNGGRKLVDDLDDDDDDFGIEEEGGRQVPVPPVGGTPIITPETVRRFLIRLREILDEAIRSLEPPPPPPPPPPGPIIVDGPNPGSTPETDSMAWPQPPPPKPPGSGQGRDSMA